MGSAGRSAADVIGIALHLVGLLPTIPLQLAFNTITPELPGYTLRALTYASQDSVDRGAMSVLGEELTRAPTRGHDQSTQASSRVTTMDTASTRFVTIRGTGDDRPRPKLLPTAQHALLAAHRSAAIVPDSMSESPILRNPTYQVLTILFLGSLHLTPRHPQVIPIVEGDLTLILPKSCS